ncbi:hypothetical protein BLA60_27835 [Actinophytocola xinjiangensis]|uniref:Carrier domain-containing protein n=1 Tax=Actinophytocola xinjiangensis TaxID=485602 RepID=A0A7Z0WII4_9PSEU|nr:non-ribosomal peptide synthetase [Actinophytocola xinjiangensis]OLF07378.1 hypothetical protein BLA60_27835 [Actinophytocola xinjiangensis]
MTTPDLLDRLHALPERRRIALLRALRHDPARYDLHPLTSAQRRMWLHDKLYPGSPMCLVHFDLTLTGDLDVAALVRAFDLVLARHQALRTLYAEIDGEQWQLVLPEASPRTRLTVADEETGADEVFDLTAGPPVRATLVPEGPGRWRFHLRLHHIACDGWTMGLIFDDLSRCYAGAVPDPAPRHVDVATESDDPALEAFWRAELAGAPVTTDLPLDRPRPLTLDESGAELEFRWPADLATGAGRLAAACDATPFMVLLTAWQATLLRYGRDRDVVVATPVAGRTTRSSEDAVGLFVNTVPLRATMDDTTTFRELLARARDTTLAAITHQQLPYDTLVHRLRPDRDPGNTPLAQVMFAVESAWTRQLVLPGVTVTGREVATGTSVFDLTLTLVPGPDGIDGRLEYRTSLFDEATARRVAGHVRTLLTAALADPDRRVADLPLLAPGEPAGRGAGRAAPPFRPVADLVAEVAAGAPDRIAVVTDTERLTYGELMARADQLAALLLAGGAGRETPVGVCLPACADAVAAFLGVLRAGAVYVPIDPDLPEERIGLLIADAGVSTVLAHTATGTRLPGGLDTHRLDTLAPAPAPPPAVPVHPDQAAYVIYTSGSTGRPKGVVSTHRGLAGVSAAIGDLLPVGPDDRVLQFHSPGFDAVVSDFVTALAAGAQLHVVGRHDRVPGPDLTRTLRQRRITFLDVPPVALQAMDPAELPELRMVTVGGETCPADVAAAWSAGREFRNTYGPTETAVMVVAGRYPGGPVVPLGEPMTGARIHVLDEWLRPVPDGIAGELCVGGAPVGRGYLDRPGATAAAFVPDPYAPEPGARMYRTGDLARWRPDGTLEFLGRSDGQVKIRGNRVEPGEAQARLGDCAGVARCAVVVREDRPGDRRLVGYVVPEAGAEVAADAVRAQLSRVLPDYLVPSAFVTLADLPTTANGKLDHRRLPAPTVERPALSTAFRAPRGPVEQTIAGVWRATLALDEVGADDNFFDLGGNSMLLVQVHSGLKAALGVAVAAVELFRYPTVARLAEFIERGERDQQPVPASSGAGRRAMAARARRIAGEAGPR